MEWCVTGRVLHYHLLVLSPLKKRVNFYPRKLGTLSMKDENVRWLHTMEWVMFLVNALLQYIWRNIKRARDQQHFCYIQRGYRGWNKSHGVRHLVVICPIAPLCGQGLFLCSFPFIPPFSEWCVRLLPASSTKWSEHLNIIPITLIKPSY